MKNVFSINRRNTLSTDKCKELILAALPNIRRYAYSLTANTADADDLLQSLVERLLKTSIPSDANSMAWMLRVCRNLWINELRKRKVSSVYLEQILDSSEPNLPLEEEVQQQIVFEDIQDKLLTLSVQQREVLSLVIMSGLSYAETATVMGAPVGTVMSRLSRARQALTQAIKCDAGESS